MPRGQGKWFSTWEQDEAEILVYARGRGWRLWRVHEKGSGCRTLYAGTQLPKWLRLWIISGKATVGEINL
jgi:hypothetical protein